MNRSKTEAEFESLRRSVKRGTPFSSAPWQARTAKRLGLVSTLRSRGRPKRNGPGREKELRPLLSYPPGPRVGNRQCHQHELAPHDRPQHDSQSDPACTIVSQSTALSFPFSVREVVLLGATVPGFAALPPG